MKPLSMAALVLFTACATATTAVGPKGVMESPIVQTGHPVLRSRAQDVPLETIATPEFQELIQRMTEAMRLAPGVGLAAPQLGVSWRVFVVEDRAELHGSLSEQELLERERVPVPLRVLVNPVVTPVGSERVTFFEGCLSVSGYAALVERWREVEVRAWNERGEPVTWRVRGWPARILQHEVDHLDGTLHRSHALEVVRHPPAGQGPLQRKAHRRRQEGVRPRVNPTGRTARDLSAPGARHGTTTRSLGLDATLATESGWRTTEGDRWDSSSGVNVPAPP